MGMAVSVRVVGLLALAALLTPLNALDHRRRPPALDPAHDHELPDAAIATTSQALLVERELLVLDAALDDEPDVDRRALVPYVGAASVAEPPHEQGGLTPVPWSLEKKGGWKNDHNEVEKSQVVKGIAKGGKRFVDTIGTSTICLPLVKISFKYVDGKPKKPSVSFWPGVGLYFKSKAYGEYGARIGWDSGTFSLFAGAKATLMLTTAGKGIVKALFNLKSWNIDDGIGVKRRAKQFERCMPLFFQALIRRTKLLGKRAKAWRYRMNQRFNLWSFTKRLIGCFKRGQQTQERADTCVASVVVKKLTAGFQKVPNMKLYGALVQKASSQMNSLANQTGQLHAFVRNALHKARKQIEKTYAGKNILDKVGGYLKNKVLDEEFKLENIIRTSQAAANEDTKQLTSAIKTDAKNAKPTTAKAKHYVEKLVFDPKVWKAMAANMRKEGAGKNAKEMGSANAAATELEGKASMLRSNVPSSTGWNNTWVRVQVQVIFAHVGLDFWVKLPFGKDEDGFHMFGFNTAVGNILEVRAAFAVGYADFTGGPTPWKGKAVKLIHGFPHGVVTVLYYFGCDQDMMSKSEAELQNWNRDRWYEKRVKKMPPTSLASQHKQEKTIKLEA